MHTPSTKPRNPNLVNNRTSEHVLEHELLRRLLTDLGVKALRPGSKKVLFRGDCPVCGQDDFFIGLLDTFPIGWQCGKKGCQKEWKMSLLGLVRAVLAGRNGGEATMNEAMDYLEDFASNHPGPDAQADADGPPDLADAKARPHPQGVLFLVPTAADAARAAQAGYPALTYDSCLTRDDAVLVLAAARWPVVVWSGDWATDEVAHAVQHALRQASDCLATLLFYPPSPLADMPAEE